ncbi:CDP-diacylglycerol--serine O-phosphatidyltransferase [Nosema granulosis]|uniref:CDP-diacylglycerol--serine O-phosphatidyltransferase n=1 Tax=Nosema granulosis TaxID=83296 RepID=A0A9P6KYF6_9MICR|nr:CDP-diacylglycerol--serine O-phosphatidyltransferase [Nosema granulosis]
MLKLFKESLNIKEETALKTYKYRTVDRSILSTLFFKKYTAWVLKHTPAYLAPNTITMIGYFSLLINFLVVIIFDQNLRNGFPLLSLFSAICLVLYFTADNIDGAQARKLKECSPMGQMFDHGVDSCCVFFCMISLISSLGLGLTYTSFMLIFCVMSGFYLAGLEEKFTGVFELGAVSGPTEGLVFIFILHLLAAFSRQTIRRAISAVTFSPYLVRNVNFPNISPLFILLVVISCYNILTSYIKCVNLSDIKKKSVVAKSYVSIILSFIPMFTLHNLFMSTPCLQMLNMIIFAQCFSLKYIEEIFSNIINSSKRKNNFFFFLYLCFGMSSVFYDVRKISTCLYLYLLISTFHYIYNVNLLIGICKRALKINVFTLNKKIK